MWGMRVLMGGAGITSQNPETSWYARTEHYSAGGDAPRDLALARAQAAWDVLNLREDEYYRTLQNSRWTRQRLWPTEAEALRRC